MVKSEGVPIATDMASDDGHFLNPMVEIDTAVSKTTLNVAWNSISPANVDSTITGYKVRWYPSAPGAGGSIGSKDVSGKETGEYAITGLTPGCYTVVVSVVNHVGGSIEIEATSSVDADADAGSCDTSEMTIGVPK